MKHAVVFFTIILFVAIIISGCKKDDNPATPPVTVTGATTYIGTLASPTETGFITLVFSASVSKQVPYSVQSAESTVSVSGYIKIAGDSILLSGTYNSVTDSLFVTGGGYTFQGKLSGGHITGGYTGPNGPGSFSASPSTSEGSVKVYCGTYQETSPTTTAHGRFNLVVTGSVVSGITDDGTQLGGAVNGNTITITITGIQVATGTISGSSISGTYSIPSNPVHSGNWQASICQ